MTETAHLALPLIEPAQAQKHVTHNEALAMLDASVHLTVGARNVVTPPIAPGEGDRFLVGAGATGAFAGKEKQVAAFLAGGWTFLRPSVGWRLYVAAEALLLLYNGADWIDLGFGLRELQNLSRLGLGTSADAGNPLAAKLNAALFAAKTSSDGGSGDLRFTLNKEASTRTVSQIYQSNYSGRAETGLAGDDNFRIKVSADGALWRESLVIDRATGAVSFPSGGPTRILTFRTSGLYTPSPGLRFADVILFGGGGGGGSGARQTPGAAASGGGGGGGAWIKGSFPAAAIGNGQSVAIGAGGAGGAAQTANSSPGLAGAAGGDSSFGSLMKAFGGGAGAGGALGAAAGGGGGSGLTKGANAPGATGGGGSGAQGSGGSGGGGGLSQLRGFGGGGGGAPADGSAGGAGGAAYFGASGGGGGGGLTAANVATNGGSGGAFYPSGIDTRGSAGAASGAIAGGAGPGNFASATGALAQPGGGGGGGASGTTLSGAGGAGGFPSGGGGGSGAHQNGGSGGAGGSGAAGFAVIIEYF